VDTYDSDEFALFVVATDYNKQGVVEYMQAHSYNFTELGWDGGSNPLLNLYNDYCGNLDSVPQTYIIDADRNCRYIFTDTIGYVTAVTNVVDELI
jgi:hypothetical protein